MPGPTITISPAPGPVARWSNIVVEITDTVPVVLELIRVRPLLGVDHVVAFQSGAAPATAFAYSNFPLISTEAITNGYRYTFQGSWVTSFDVIVDARNATDGSTVSASFLADDPYVPLALIPPTSPAPGPIGADDPIVLDMNYDSGISSYAIYVLYADEFMQLVVAELAAFAVFGVVGMPPYTAVESNPSPDVLRVTLQNLNGWRRGLFQVYVASTTDGVPLFVEPEGIFDGAAWTSTATAPGVTVISPTPGTPIAATTPIVFEVVDDSGAFRRVLVAVYDPTTGATVIVHDGDAFLGGFALKSERTLIAGGFRFAIVPDNGWTASPTLRVFAIDRTGDEV